MQNIDLSKIITNNEENLDLTPIASKGPASLDCILDATDILDTKTGFQSDPETQRTKEKSSSRSRFSAAFRRLSKSTRKKEHPTITKKDLKLSDSTVTVEAKTSSIDAPHINEKPAKKKSSLSKRFLLGGLKRTQKSSSKKSTDEEDNIILVSNSGTQTTNTLERRSTLPTQGPHSSDITDTLRESHTSLVTAGSLSSGGGGGSLQRLDRIRKVQITIRGKKIEHTQSEISVQTTGGITDKIPPAAEKDYLIPTTTEPGKAKQSILVTTSSVVRSRSPSPGSSPTKSGATDPKTKTTTKKKLKTKKITSSTTKQIATTTTTKTTKTTNNNNNKITQTTTAPTLTQPTTTTNESTEEKDKFVITRSTRDTPPRERAPAKPSRVAATTVALAPTSQSATATGAIRKSTLPRLTTVKQQQQEHKTATAKSSSNNIEADLLKSQTDLMHNPQDGIEQRGHRFPRPSTPTAITAATTETIGTTTIGNETPPPPATTTPTTAKTPSIEITAATATTIDTTQRQRQRQIEFQLQSESQASKTLSLSSTSPPNDLQSEPPPPPPPPSSLQPPTYPPPPIPSGTSTPAERRSHSPLPSEQLYLATRFLPGAATKSVLSAHSSDQDEPISSAESAQQQHSSYARNYGEISFDSNKSSESQSPVSETSRRRIRYVAQPTLYDDDDEEQPAQGEEEQPASRPESRREALSYLYSAVSDYSLESEEGDQGDNQLMPAFGDLTMDQGEPPIMTSTAEKREHLYKILVIGELGTGKTSFIKRYVHQFFSQNYRATIGVDFALKVLHWDANTIVRLQLWDIAGQERFGNMTRVYYKEAVGAFIVFDVTRSGTFDCVSKWKDDLDSKVQLPDGSPIPCILLANKCDQDKQGVVTTPEKMDEYVKENGFAGWFETSAKENINIDEAARALVNKILLNDKLISAADIADSEKFNLNNSAEQSVTETKSKCSC